MQTIRLNHSRNYPLAAALGLLLLVMRPAAAQNFTMTVEPGSVILIPTKTASFVVTLTPLGGFTSQVALAVGTLPAGVTAQFSPNPLTLPETALLTLSANSNAPIGSFTLDVIASGGGITNNTASTVSVQFGLLPLCTGALEGAVTDIETGLPVPGAHVTAGWPTLADATGHYLITNLALSTDNQPYQYNVWASRTDYWQSANISSWAVCDVTNTVNLAMLHQRYGSISGTVLLQGGQPATNVQVCVWGPGSGCTNTDANGTFQSQPLTLAYSNAATRYSVAANANGYWTASTNTPVSADSNSVVSLVLVPICTASITGQVRFADTLLPVANVFVRVTDVSNYGSLTDSNGYYAISALPMAAGNTPMNVQIDISWPPAGYQGYYGSATLTSCAEVLGHDIRLVPVPRVYYGAVAGHIIDSETGQPVPNASVGFSGWACTGGGSSDATGAYLVTNITVGMVPAATYNGSVWANAAGYFGSGYSNVTFIANQTVTQDFRLLPFHYGAFTGVVRDSATHLAIANATITYSQRTTSTGPEGRYTTAPIPLPAGNAPTYESFSAGASGYWTTFTNTTITADTTNVVDIDLVKVCTGATVVGTVVNALTQQPIAGATVYNSAVGWVLTDTNGSFVLKGIPAGNFNSPTQVAITASASGFNSQSQIVTIFCGATITVEFGAPQTAFSAIEGFVTNALTGAPLTNVFIGSEFGAATSTDTNGYYRLDQVPLGANGADRTWTITAMPDGFSSQTKSILVSSNTVSRLDFGFGQPSTRLILSARAAPSPVDVGSNLLYTVTVTNAAADAANVQLADTLPPAVTFLSASVTNLSGGFFSAPVFSHGAVTTMATNFSSNSVAILSIAVRPASAGSLTNVATVTSDTPDFDATGSNHTAVVMTTVNGPAVTNVSVQVLGAIVFDRQTGLFDQPIEFNNLSGTPVSGIRISVIGLPDDVVLYNASGSTNGAPFVEYDQTVAAGGNVSFVFEYYRSDRLAFVSTNFSAVAVAAAAPSIPNGTPLQLDREPFMRSGALVIEFASTPGATYAVQYSADLQTWKTAVPPIVAAGTRVQWADAGPPKTDSPPGSPGQRFYRIVKLP